MEQDAAKKHLAAKAQPHETHATLALGKAPKAISSESIVSSNLASANQGPSFKEA